MRFPTNALAGVAALVATFLSAPVIGQSPLGGSLPALAVVGEAPKDDVFAVEFHKNGMLSRNGVPLTYQEFGAELKKHAKGLPGKRVGAVTVSRLNVLIRADQSLPAAAVTQLLWTCARADVAAPRVFFGARHRVEDFEGAIAMFLPIDRPRSKTPREAELVPVFMTPRAKASGDALRGYLSRMAKVMPAGQRKDAVVQLKAPGDVTWGTLLGAADAVAHAGLPYAVVECRLTQGQARAWQNAATRNDLTALVRAAPTQGDVMFRVGPVTVRPAKTPMAVPAPSKGALVGFMDSDVPSYLEEDIFEEEVEDEPMIEEDEILDSPEVTETAIEQPPVPGLGGKFGNRGKVMPVRLKRVVETGIDWLVRHQDQDGRWDADGFMKHDKATGGTVSDGPGNPANDVGATGLALLALLAEGNTTRTGPHKENVTRAVRWLRKQQKPSGLIGTQASHDFIYGHAMATWALVEAYGLSQDPIAKPVAQNAINYLEMHRNPYAVWRYQPRDNDNDTSVTSWCAMSYLAARDFDLQVNLQALKLVEGWLDQVTDPATGRHGYTKRGEMSARNPGDHATRFPVGKNEPITGAGLFVRFMLGQDPAKVRVMKSAADLVVSKPPKWDTKSGQIDFYAWFWSSHAMYQMGGAHWKKWSRSMAKALVESQSTTGNAKGSWDPVGVWGESGGRVYSTALATLTLQTYYRYSRLVR